MSTVTVKPLAAAYCLMLVASLLFSQEDGGGATAERARLPARPKLTYFGEIKCSHCDTFFSNDLYLIEQRTGVQADTEAVDILTPAGFERCKEELAALGQEFRVFPVAIIGNNAYQGNAAIDAHLADEFVYFAERGEYRPSVTGGAERAQEPAVLRIEALPVIVAGLIDGINPCAFATMLFFMSWITLRGGGKRRLILAGGAFISGVFIAYFVIGIGFSRVVTSLSGYSTARLVMRSFFALSSLVLAVLSGIDAVRVRRGEASSMTLQLPAPVKRLIHAVIKESPDAGTRPSPVVFAGFFMSGLTVSLLELACTGQVYFPTIAYMVQTGSGTGSRVALIWLLVYNLAFIVPLAAVFSLCVMGTGVDRIRVFFARRLGVAKIAIAALFAALAALIWFS